MVIRSRRHSSKRRTQGKNHKKKKPVKKGKMKPQKLFKEPCTPGKKAKEEPHGQMRPCSGESRTTPSNMIVTSTPSTPFKTPNSVASRCAHCWLRSAQTCFDRA